MQKPPTRSSIIAEDADRPAGQLLAGIDSHHKIAQHPCINWV
jgi:hypothetical protein